jgi:hypothetical protein
MSVLTCPKPLNQTIDQTVPAFGVPVSRRPSPSGKANPHRQEATSSAEPFWGVALKKFEAENLLDWLEAHSYCGKLSFVPGEGFTVR